MAVDKRFDWRKLIRSSIAKVKGNVRRDWIVHTSPGITTILAK